MEVRRMDAKKDLFILTGMLERNRERVNQPFISWLAQQANPTQVSRQQR